MSSKVQWYLRSLRRQWGLTQEEVLSLLPKGGRNRVSRVERGLVPPNAHEIVAYKLIFGSSAKALFPRFTEEVEEVVMQRAYRLHKKLARQNTREATRKLKLLERMLARATGKASRKSL